MSYHIRTARVPNSETKLFREGGRPHYNVKIYLEADELDQVDSVEYKLHETFKNRHRIGRDRMNKLEIRIWSWDYFNARAKVIKNQGAPEAIQGLIKWWNL